MSIDSKLSRTEIKLTKIDRTLLSKSKIISTRDDNLPLNYDPSKSTLWKAILKKEAKLSKKLNSKNCGLIDIEAEEDNDENIVGLENFGFVLKCSKRDEEDNFTITDDDFYHIVDDISDNEGDEEAGEAARKALDAKDDKYYHNLIIRKMKDGYDGRRASIAVGFSATRGYNRVDQLLAPDNRKDARYLGLLNDDELDSDEELNCNRIDEIEDDAILLDKILKDRFLKRDVPVSKTSDDNTGEDTSATNLSGQNSDSEESIALERLAQRFSKRAKMNRLLEIFRNDSKFSKPTLPEDNSLKKDLKLVKNINSLKRPFQFALSPKLSSLYSYCSSSPRDLSFLFRRQKYRKTFSNSSNRVNLKLMLTKSNN